MNINETIDCSRSKLGRKKTMFQLFILLPCYIPLIHNTVEPPLSDQLLKSQNYGQYNTV